MYNIGMKNEKSILELNENRKMYLKLNESIKLIISTKIAELFVMKKQIYTTIPIIYGVKYVIRYIARVAL